MTIGEIKDLLRVAPYRVADGDMVESYGSVMITGAGASERVWSNRDAINVKTGGEWLVGRTSFVDRRVSVVGVHPAPWPS